MKKILLILAIIISAIGIADVYRQNKNPSSVKAYGALTINFHSPLPGNAIFDIKNFVPGQSVSKSIDIKNSGDNTEVFVKGIKRSGSGNPKLENVLGLKITQGSSVLYDKKLINFLNGDKVSLGKINKNQTKTYTFQVTFESSAGNAYQNKFVKFDMDFSSSGEVKGTSDEGKPGNCQGNGDNHGKIDIKKIENDIRSGLAHYFR
ncbi:MAG: hypothetical protein NTZ07_02530 [Candidatus Woesebacteria bacterium]|nr:hypothetical protein [Candidatus Woesebacteria bacterium]